MHIKSKLKKATQSWWKQISRLSQRKSTWIL